MDRQYTNSFWNVEQLQYSSVETVYTPSLSYVPKTYTITPKNITQVEMFNYSAPKLQNCVSTFADYKYYNSVYDCFSTLDAELFVVGYTDFTAPISRTLQVKTLQIEFNLTSYTGMIFAFVFSSFMVTAINAQEPRKKVKSEILYFRNQLNFETEPKGAIIYRHSSRGFCLDVWVCSLNYN